MYRRPKFLEILLEIREQMSREADYDIEAFAENFLPKNKISDENQSETDEKPSGRVNLKTETVIKKG